MMIISNLQGKYGSRGGCEGICTDPQTPMRFILPHVPHNFIFLFKVKAPHLLRLTMLLHFLRDLSLSFMGIMGTFRAQLTLSSHPPDPHSLPPSSQPVPLLLRVFFGVQVLCSHCSSVFMAATAWPFPGHHISWPSSLSSASHDISAPSSLSFLGFGGGVINVLFRTEDPTAPYFSTWPAAHLCITCHPLPKNHLSSRLRAEQV